MGSMSILHWLLLLLVVGVIVLLVRILRRPNRVTRWMMRIAERRYFRTPARDVEGIAEPRTLVSPVRSIDMAVVAAISLAAIVLLFILARNRTDLTYHLALDGFTLTLRIITLVGIIAAVLLHFTPNINRVRKY